MPFFILYSRADRTMNVLVFILTIFLFIPTIVAVSGRFTWVQA